MMGIRRWAMMAEVQAGGVSSVAMRNAGGGGMMVETVGVLELVR